MAYRKLVVDGTTYLWRVDRHFVHIRPPHTKQGTKAAHHQITGLPDIEDDGDWEGHYANSITPFDVANWIRVNIEKRPAIERPPRPLPTYRVEKKLMAAGASQPTAYLVMRVRETREGWFRLPLEVHLDPQIAKDRVETLDGLIDRNAEKLEHVSPVNHIVKELPLFSSAEVPVFMPVGAKLIGTDARRH